MNKAGNARVVHFDPIGKYVGEWGELGSKPGQFSIPHAIAADAKGRIYVADRNNVRVQKFDGKGKLLDVWNNLIVPWEEAIQMATDGRIQDAKSIVGLLLVDRLLKSGQLKR